MRGEGKGQERGPSDMQTDAYVVHLRACPVSALGLHFRERAEVSPPPLSPSPSSERVEVVALGQSAVG